MELSKRKLQRLSGYNYAEEGYYFVTICTKSRQKLFWYNGTVKSVPYDEIIDIVPYSDIGFIARDEMTNIQQHFKNVKIEKYVIMPNHIHCIVVIGCDETERSRPFPTLSSIVGLYKSGVSKKVHKAYPGIFIWQTSFYDHIIRKKDDYLKIWQYIDQNPYKWEDDCFYM